jgi:hypothetical protein
MNRTIKDATVRRFYYDTHSSLCTHLATFLDAYNFAKRLKSLRGLTPYERICQLWTEQPERFRLNPLHHMAGLNTYTSANDGQAPAVHASFRRDTAIGSVVCRAARWLSRQIVDAGS